MPARDYAELQTYKLEQNPCNIFKYLTINNGKLRLNEASKKKQFRSGRSYAQ